MTSNLTQHLKIVVIDDHALILRGVVSAIKGYFPRVDVHCATDATTGFALVQQKQPDLVLLDLSLPESLGTTVLPRHGLQLLKDLMKEYPELNITVQSSNIKALMRLIPEIDNHQGGFTIADKLLPVETLLKRMEWAVQGINYTQDLQRDLEIKPEWLEVLELAFEAGLQDKAIAEKMHKSERMIRHYWSKIRDVLGVYPEAKDNVRSLTYIQAKKVGLVD
ncbi:response regulator [Oscillatoria salina]|uniref:response regulator n=1 Tax=Oscillatoria salina TaxID=331517 RepID=UPI0013B6515C|nr:response regulator transcription factor [Oscillatoria salina]MBZ8180645.1 response regulator transcription factor [Oscillatoria salina IIICB1]NET89674.1 response regulator transcription factor [Kamptonema sp. SIO1D9]